MSDAMASPKLTRPVNEHDHIQGPENAQVTLVEYGDYECPYCGDAYQIVKQVQQQLGKRLRFVFRNFPLRSIHPYAEHAAEAAEAANGQGKFWQMHDYLYEHQDELDDRGLRHAAKAIGLDGEQFDRDMTGHTYAGRVREDFMSGVRSGVNGTPTFFINGRRYNGSWDYPELLQALDQAE